MCFHLDDLAGLAVASRLQEGKEQDVEHGHLSSLLAHKIHGWREEESDRRSEAAKVDSWGGVTPDKSQ